MIGGDGVALTAWLTGGEGVADVDWLSPDGVCDGGGFQPGTVN